MSVIESVAPSAAEMPATAPSETRAETWVIRAVVVGAILQVLATLILLILKLGKTHHPLLAAVTVANCALALALATGVHRRSFACATLLLMDSMIARTLILPHRHGRFLVAAAVGLIVSTVLYGLGVWATHAIDLRANPR
jgi:hypothetical protein